MVLHFLQSKSWEKFLSEKEKKQTFRILENTPDETLAVLETTPIGNYLFCPYGPQSIKAEVISKLKEVAKENHCFFIRLEPLEKITKKSIKKYNLKPTKHINPSDTWILDLTAPKEEIITNFSHGIRLGYNTFSKKGLEVIVSNNPEDIKYLNRLQAKLAQEKGINVFEGDYLKHELEMPFASLYLVKYQDKIISASLFFDDDKNKTRFYMQSASDTEFKKLPATVALLTTSIFDAKEKGLKYFDFWGIAPENAPKNHPWAGFTKFKKSFGGFKKSYAGTFDLPLNSIKYTLYQILRKINLVKRKLSPNTKKTPH